MIRKHLARVQRARRKSNKSVAVFTKTEAKLQKQNETIQRAIGEIDADIAALQSLKDEAVAHHKVNTSVLENIAKLLRG